jgi:hypothetical protein
MAGPVLAIQVFVCRCGKDVDARHKAGHDELVLRIVHRWWNHPSR